VAGFGRSTQSEFFAGFLGRLGVFVVFVLFAFGFAGGGNGFFDLGVLLWVVCDAEEVIAAVMVAVSCARPEGRDTVRPRFFK